MARDFERDAQDRRAEGETAGLTACYLDLWQQNLAVLGAEFGVLSPDHTIGVVEHWFRSFKPTP